MRSTLVAVAALAFLRIVVGLHFFLEGSSHLRDPEWSSAGFRKAAVGPLAESLRAGLPQTGDWSGTLGGSSSRPASELSDAWKKSIVAAWKKRLEQRVQAVALTAEQQASADSQLKIATQELDDFLAPLDEELADYSLQVQRLATMDREPTSAGIPYARQRVAKKRRELSAQATGWMNDAAAIGEKLEGEWDRQIASELSPSVRLQLSNEFRQTSLWKIDRFVSWSLATIGICLVLGILTKFNAMGGVFFLTSVILAQPFWVVGAQPTYDQWVEMAALLVIAALPAGGWSGLDYFLSAWCPWCRNNNVCSN